MSRCIVPGCIKDKNHSIFRAPLDIDRREQWSKAIRDVYPKLDLSINYHVCEKHFQRSDFSSYLADETGFIMCPEVPMRRKSLKKEAVPRFDMLNLGFNYYSMSYMADEPRMHVPPVIRQYTRKKKNLKAEPPALFATLSNQSQSEVNVYDYIKIEENSLTDRTLLDTNIKVEPNTLCVDMIKKEKDEDGITTNANAVTHMRNVDIKVEPNTLRVDIIKKEKDEDGTTTNTNAVTDMRNVDIKVEANTPCIDIIKFEKDNDDIIMKGNAVTDIKLESNTSYDDNIKEETNADDDLNENSTYDNDHVKIEEDKLPEIDVSSEINIIDWIKKEPAEEAEVVRNTLCPFNQTEGHAGLQTITLKRCVIVAVNGAPGNPLKIEAPKVLDAAEWETVACDKCGRHFRKAAILKHMIRSHNENARHACTICTMRFHHYFELIAHLREHKGKPFNCDLCPKRFMRRRGYAMHMNSHLREQLHSCPVCLRRFATTDALLGHASRHSREDSFECAACAARFPQALDLRFHQEAAHGESALHPCYVCSSAFPSRARLTDHLRTHTEASHYCVFCGERFSDFRQWEDHSADHISKRHVASRKPYACPVCHKSFAYRSTLATHVSAHGGERPYSCGECSRSYKTQSALSAHGKAHSRPYACDTCGARFGRTSTLAHHVRTHTGERPYACSLCKATFAQRYELVTHTRRHHEPRLKRAPKKHKSKTGKKSKT